MAKDLPKINTAACIIWGKNDIVTPPNVAEEFHSLLPNSDLINSYISVKAIFHKASNKWYAIC